MTGSFDPNNVLILMYFGGTGMTVYKLAQSWREFWSDSPDLDIGALATWTSLFLMTPLCVLLRGLAQVGVALAVGETLYGFNYSLYFVNVYTSYGSLLNYWWIANAEDLANYLLALIFLVVSLFGKRLGRPLRMVLADTGVIELTWTLIATPVLGVASGNYSAWSAIYPSAIGIPATVTIGLHVIAVVVYYIFMNRSKELRKLIFTRGSTEKRVANI